MRKGNAAGQVLVSPLTTQGDCGEVTLLPRAEEAGRDASIAGGEATQGGGRRQRWWRKVRKTAGQLINSHPPEFNF